MIPLQLAVILSLWLLSLFFFSSKAFTIPTDSDNGIATAITSSDTAEIFPHKTKRQIQNTRNTQQQESLHETLDKHDNRRDDYLEDEDRSRNRRGKYFDHRDSIFFFYTF